MRESGASPEVKWQGWARAFRAVRCTQSAVRCPLSLTYASDSKAGNSYYAVVWPRRPCPYLIGRDCSICLPCGLPSKMTSCVPGCVLGHRLLFVDCWIGAPSRLTTLLGNAGAHLVFPSAARRPTPSLRGSVVGFPSVLQPFPQPSPLGAPHAVPPRPRPRTGEENEWTMSYFVSLHGTYLWL